MMMELSPKQQAIELIKDSRRILILTHENPDGDALGSVLAMTLALDKLKKDTTAAIADTIPNLYNFLPQIDILRNEVTSGKEFTISVSTADVEIEKLGYKNIPEEKKLNIVISTKEGTLEPQHVSIGTSSVPYDLIIVLDSPDLDRLGTIYDNDSELFYEVPVINIDHHPSNEYFGRVNWVDVTATSTAEILVALIEAMGSINKNETSNLMDPDIATSLLTGLTTDTGSFQNANTTPKSLTVAAQLVAGGARQQEIIKYLFKIRPLSTLKLWGMALTSIKEVPEAGFVYSVLSAGDFVKANADEQEASGVIDELMKTTTGVDFVLLIVERGGGVHGSLRAVEKGIDVASIARIFGGGGHEAAAAFHLENTTIEREEGRIVSKISDYQKKRRGFAQVPSAMPSLENRVADDETKIESEKKSDRLGSNGASKW